jgi:chromosome segregation ATPase
MTSTPATEIQRKVRQLDNDVTDIYSMLTSIQAGQQRQAHRIDEVDRKLHEHDARFDGITAKLVEHDARLDAVDARFDVVEGKLDVVEGKLDVVEGKLDEVLGLLRPS